MIYRFADFALDDELYELRHQDEPLAVERRVLDLLIHLVHNRDRVVSRSELAKLLWPDTTVDDQHGLDQAIYAARRTLQDDARNPRFIATHRGRGFRFVHEVSETLPLRRLEASEPFVGRTSSLEALYSAMRSSQEAGLCLAVVTGEPGIGKSRLLEELRRHLQEESLCSYLIRCASSTATPAFWCWRELLRQLDPDVLRSSGNPSSATHLNPLIARSESLEVDSLSETGRFLLFEAVIDLLSKLSAAAPMAILVDDIDCADDSSLALLEYLVRQRRVPGILIVAACRLSAFSQGPQTDRLSILAGMASSLIELEPLGWEDTERYVTSVLGVSPEPSFISRLLGQTGGNPLFLKQLCASGAASSSDASAPLSLRQLVRSRLHELREHDRNLLQLAAVVGREVSVDILSALAEHGAHGALARAEAVGLLRRRPGGETYEFSHDLVREQLYETLPPPERAKAHERVLRSLETHGASLLERAYHAQRAGRRVEDGAAAFLLVAAGDEAFASHAYEEAANLYSSALQRCQLGEIPDQAVRCRLGRALFRSGKRPEATRNLVVAAREADARGDWKVCSDAALNIAPRFYSIEAGVVDLEAISALRAALACVAGRPIEAVLQSRLAMALYWDPTASAERRWLISSALSKKRQLSLASSAELLAYRIAALWSPFNTENRRRLSLHLVRAADEAGDQELALMGQVFLITCALEEGDVASLRTYVHLFERRFSAYPIPQLRWYLELFKGMLAGLEGRLDQLEESARRVLKSGAFASDNNVINSFAPMLIFARWHQGRLDEVLSRIPEIIERFPTVPAWQTARAFLLNEAGWRSEAAGEYARLIQEWEAWDQNLTWALAVVTLGDLCADLGDQRMAKVLKRAVSGLRDKACIVGYGVLYWGSIDRVLGRLEATAGNWRMGAELLRSAIGFEERTRSTVWKVRAISDLVEVLVRNDRRATGEVESLLSSAYAEAREWNFAGLQARLEKLRKEGWQAGIIASQ